jgi:hypothetical protein
MSTIKAALPLLALHEGTWQGTYRYYDSAGEKVDEHESRLVLRLPAEGPWPYVQTSEYTWPSGKREKREFTATYRDGRLWFDSERISGWAAEVTLDAHRRTAMLYWTRKDEPGTYLYEMSQLSDCRRYRTRIGQWLAGGQTRLRILIDEQRVEDAKAAG